MEGQGCFNGAAEAKNKALEAQNRVVVGLNSDRRFASFQRGA
jgi:hypothetical protein